MSDIEMILRKIRIYHNANKLKVWRVSKDVFEALGGIAGTDCTFEGVPLVYEPTFLDFTIQLELDYGLDS